MSQHWKHTADPNEILFIDTNPAAVNKRTGFFFFAWIIPSLAPPGAQPVCKFYGSRTEFIDSYYYTSDPAECAFVQATSPGTWTLVTPANLPSAASAVAVSRSHGMLPAPPSCFSRTAPFTLLRSLDVPLIDEAPRVGAHGHKVAFVHPKATGGVLIELVEEAGAEG